MSAHDRYPAGGLRQQRRSKVQSPWGCSSLPSIQIDLARRPGDRLPSGLLQRFGELALEELRLHFLLFLTLAKERFAPLGLFPKQGAGLVNVRGFGVPARCAVRDHL